MPPPQALQEAPASGGTGGDPTTLLQGTLRSWRDPWGFIVCPEAFEGDLFAHRDSFTEPPPAGNLAGVTVQFTREHDSRGRMHANNVHLLSFEGVAPQAVEEPKPI